MTMNTEATTKEAAVKIAAALLQQYGQISVSEIRALPFVQTDEEAMMIARSLAEAFDVQIEQIRQTVHSPINRWVDTLRLKSGATR